MDFEVIPYGAVLGGGGGGKYGTEDACLGMTDVIDVIAAALDVGIMGPGAPIVAGVAAV